MRARLNGYAVLEATIREPRIGAWTVEVDVDSDTSLSGAVELAVGDVSWHGTVVRGSLENGHYHAVIVAGQGGLGTKLPAKHYTSAPMSVMLSEIFAGCGETQSQATSSGVLNAFMDRWSRSAASAGQCFRQVATDLGVSWRVLRDGTVWHGPETWPPLDVEHLVIDQLPGRGRVLIAPEAFTLRPGVTWNGQAVSEVVTTISSSGFLQELVLEDGAVGELDKSLGTIASVVDSLVGRRIEVSNTYPAVCASDSAADGTVDVITDDERMRGTGMTRVPVRPGLPGTSVKLKAGSRLTLYFEDNDILKPAASLWQSGAGVLEILIEADTKLTLKAPTVRVEGDLDVTGEVTANADLVPTTLSQHQHPTAMGPSGSPVPGT